MGVTDTFLYAEAGRVRHAVISQMDIPRLAAAGTGAVLHPLDGFGIHELYEQSLGHGEVLEQVAVRFCREQGTTRRWSLVPSRCGWLTCSGRPGLRSSPGSRRSATAAG